MTAMSRIANKRKTPPSPASADFDWRFGGFEPESWVGLRSSKAMTTCGQRTSSAVQPTVILPEARPAAPSLAMRLVQRIRSILAARRDRRVLERLLDGDDRMLTDIGLTRGEVRDMIARV
jgi:uncharacterized protein YjiS (DUF1127 family)